MAPTRTPTPKKNITTCICGGGSTAHVLVPFLAEQGHTVNVYTRRPDEWKDEIVCEVTDGLTGEITSTHRGKLNLASDDPAKVVAPADIVVFCMPVHKYRPVLDQIAPHVNTDKAVFIGTIFGQGMFDKMVEQSVIKNYGKNNVVAFAIGQIPWICRTQEYGKRVANYGGKFVNVVAVDPVEKFEQLNEMFLKDISLRPLNKGRFELASQFLDLTMSADNQTIHPARCYGLWKQSGGSWATPQDVPYFYRDFNKESADILERLDGEYDQVRNAIKAKFPDRDFKYMLNYSDLERLNHQSEHVDILGSLKDSAQLASIKTPVAEGPDGRQYLNKDFRFFLDDIPYGLLIAKSFAEMLNVDTPFIDEIIGWAQSLRGEMFLVDGKINKEYCLNEKYLCGIPEVYGISKIEELVQ